MPALHPSLAHRARLGPIQIEAITAPSLVEAHAELGVRVSEAARWAIAGRLAATPGETLAQQITSIRACRAFMEGRAADERVATPVRHALAELLACLDAWSRPLGLDPCLDGRPPIDGRRLSAEDLALWAQDDNTGCQTGMLRQRDGSVLVWHTEEDTIGFLDRPRLAAITVGGEERCAFLYPYLLPGPAFGWRAGQFHAVDSLHARRAQPFEGTLSGVASWLVWRLGLEADTAEVLRALAPFVDGCAVHVARSGAGGVSAETHEMAGRALVSRRLGARSGAVTLQVNAVSRSTGPLAREEDMRQGSRILYERRLERMRAGVARVLAQPGGYVPQDVLRMLASRRGGSYAYANADVKAHAVAHVSASGIEVHVESGPAHGDDVYRPQWRVSPRRESEITFGH
jgi:hypothetical protein